MQWVRNKQINLDFVFIGLFRFYRLPDGTKVMLDKNRMAAAARNTRQYLNDFQYDRALCEPISEEAAQIVVIDGDCLDAVMFFKSKYPNCNPVVLNMASKRNPGGGWKNGSFNFH